MEEQQVLLRPKGSEDAAVKLSRSAAMMSGVIREMLDDDPDSYCVPEIPLPNVGQTALLQVCQFCIKHVGDPMTKISRPLASTDLTVLVGKWDADFINALETTQQLFDLILAANYLDIPDLLDLGCAKLTVMIKDKSPEEIAALFGQSTALTAAEEEKIRKDHPWIFDIT